MGTRSKFNPALRNARDPFEVQRKFSEVGGHIELFNRFWNPVINVVSFGARGDGVTDDTAAIQKAIASIRAGGIGTTLFFPPGVYLVTDTLQFTSLSGLVVAGAGAVVDVSAGWLAVQGGAIIKASGMGSKPVVDFNGCNTIQVHDLSVWGNTSETLTGAAAFGIRIRGLINFGGGGTLFSNVTVHWCAEGVNAGNDDDGINAADCTFHKCLFSRCATAFHSEHDQAVNFDFYGCALNFCTDGFKLFGGSVFASLLSTYDVTRLVYVPSGGAGPNAGHVTMIGVKIDGIAVRTVVYEVDPGADVSHGDFTDVSANQSQPAGGARFKLAAGAVCRVYGGRGLCNADGVLFDLDSAGGNCAILVEGAEISANVAEVVGSVDVGCKYRVRDCFDEAARVFLADYQN